MIETPIGPQKWMAYYLRLLIFALHFVVMRCFRRKEIGAKWYDQAQDALVDSCGNSSLCILRRGWMQNDHGIRMGAQKMRSLGMGEESKPSTPAVEGLPKEESVKTNSIREAIEALANGLKNRRAADGSAYECGLQNQAQSVARLLLDILAAHSEPSREETRFLCDTSFDDEVWRCEACGDEWIFTDGTPEENNMNYCHRCGRKIIEIVRLKPEEDDDE
jgi:rubrerythrin